MRGMEDWISRGLARRDFFKVVAGAAAALAAGCDRPTKGDATTSATARAKAAPSTSPSASQPVKAPPTGVLYDPVYKEHDTGSGHPESPQRCDAIMGALDKSDFADRLLRLAPRPASQEEILLCHTQEYLDTVKRDFAASRTRLSTGDTQVGPRSYDVALAAAGGVLNAVDAVMEGKVKNAFCVVRPPGHHATANRGMGFCIFNNVAIAARHAQQKHKLGKVMIADWDVHHGNGTQDIFYEDGTVFFFSTHQWPLYPGTGRKSETGSGKGEGYTMNRPFPAGAGREQIAGAFGELAEAMEKFKPELVLISAGFDSRVDDPLGGFELTDEDFAELTGIMLNIASRHARGRLVSVLEGGYNLTGLASAAASHVAALAKA